jgi:hypothetical protein
MFPPCIFCNNESGSEEHLWAAWMHRLLRFGPIRVQEGTGPETIDPDPEKTINTVCHTCNNTWMSQLEEKNIPSLRPMLQNQSTMIDPGRQRLLTEWGVKTAMVQDSIKPEIGNEKFYTDAERLDMRLTRKIPERTRIWIGALTEPHLGSFGTDMAIFGSDRKTRIGTGIATTIIVGHFAVQVVTERALQEFAAQTIPDIQPRAGDWDNTLIELYPKKQKKIDWPPKTSFTNGGPQGIAYLMNRWRMGQKVEKVVPVPPSPAADNV